MHDNTNNHAASIIRKGAVQANVTRKWKVNNLEPGPVARGKGQKSKRRKREEKEGREGGKNNIARRKRRLVFNLEPNEKS